MVDKWLAVFSSNRDQVILYNTQLLIDLFIAAVVCVSEVTEKISIPRLEEFRKSNWYIKNGLVRIVKIEKFTLLSLDSRLRFPELFFQTREDTFHLSRFMSHSSHNIANLPLHPKILRSNKLLPISLVSN